MCSLDLPVRVGAIATKKLPHDVVALTGTRTWTSSLHISLQPFSCQEQGTAEGGSGQQSVFHLGDPVQRFVDPAAG
ncbi:hypothetical protein CLV58_12246 [Spirosoma oryzae]|uniref:Uncharacterized protein n=1 Tax=Spirosoma oryzae TaxID=1469603 RepID=A0A2T0SED4_9BACT|nr:hypothetical protein CLV58_12246 [Spirosoma oryzae]